MSNQPALWTPDIWASFKFCLGKRSQLTLLPTRRGGILRRISLCPHSFPSTQQTCSTVCNVDHWIMQHKWHNSYVCCLYQRHIIERFGTKFCFWRIIGWEMLHLLMQWRQRKCYWRSKSHTAVRHVDLEAEECWSVLCNEDLSLSLSPVTPILEHRASVKRFVSLQFLNPKTAGRTPWTGDHPVARP
jgi:hypothetical protein